MELKDAIMKRRSIRGYRPDPVPREILREIIETSLRAPSAMNTQPWEITVITGKPLEELRNANMELLMSGTSPESDFGHQKPFEGVHKERQRALGFALYDRMGIDREDKQKRTEWAMKGFRGFDAPALIVIYADESLDERLAASDMGGLIQTICLAACEKGLGTCINSQGIMFPKAVRKITGIPESKKLHLCISTGYPDENHPANGLVSDREPMDAVVTWVGD